VNADRDLVITRDIAAPPGKLYRCRTGPDCDAHQKIGFAEGRGVRTVRPAGRTATL